MPSCYCPFMNKWVRIYMGPFIGHVLYLLGVPGWWRFYNRGPRFITQIPYLVWFFSSKFANNESYFITLETCIVKLAKWQQAGRVLTEAFASSSICYLSDSIVTSTNRVEQLSWKVERRSFEYRLNILG